MFWTRGVKSPSCFGSWRFPEKHLTLTVYLFLFHQEIDPIILRISGQVLFWKIECDKLKTINKNVRKYSICGLVFIQNNLQPNLSFFISLTSRRPLRQSWRLGVFYSSQGSALAAIPKRRKINQFQFIFKKYSGISNWNYHS